MLATLKVRLKEFLQGFSIAFIVILFFMGIFLVPAVLRGNIQAIIVPTIGYVAVCLMAGFLNMGRGAIRPKSDVTESEYPNDQLDV